MPSFYSEKENYTEAAHIFEEELYTIVNNTFDRWINEGYSIRQISHLFMTYIFEVETDKLIDKKLGLKMDSHSKE